jgi:chromosome segregation ATPase
VAAKSNAQKARQTRARSRATGGNGNGKAAQFDEELRTALVNAELLRAEESNLRDQAADIQARLGQLAASRQRLQGRIDALRELRGEQQPLRTPVLPDAQAAELAGDEAKADGGG